MNIEPYPLLIKLLTKKMIETVKNNPNIFVKCLDELIFIDYNKQLDNLLKSTISIELEGTNC